MLTSNPDRSSDLTVVYEENSEEKYRTESETLYSFTSMSFANKLGRLCYRVVYWPNERITSSFTTPFVLTGCSWEVTAYLTCFMFFSSER